MKEQQRLDYQDMRLALWNGARRAVRMAAAACHDGGYTPTNVRSLQCARAMLRTFRGIGWSEIISEEWSR